MATFRVTITGAKETQRALDRLVTESPARARAAQNRTLGVVKSRVVKSVSRMTGIPQRVLAGRQGRRPAKGPAVKGRGYFKLIKATRTRKLAALVGLVEGVLFSRLGRQRLGKSQRKPGGLGQPFRATMRSGHSSLFERKSPQTKVSRRASPNTARPNLPIREVVIPIWHQSVRAMRVHMLRAARTVFPGKIWEELQKSIKPVRR